MSAISPLLEIRGLQKAYFTPSGELVVLDNVDFELPKGASAAIMGPSGSGKSTLLHIIGLLEAPSGGTVRFDGADPFSLSSAEQAAFRNQRIGFVFQDHCLLPQLTVLENVLLPTLVSAPRDGAAENRARAILDRTGLSRRLHHKPAHLSGGERQRAAVARALINRPQLLLGDEPTGNLDRKNAAELAALLLELQRDEGLTVIVVTHSAEFAERFARKYQLTEGRLEEAGS